MADVFISYSQRDRELARGLAAALIENGCQVWWDHELVGGESYRARIKEELAKAKAAIVIWTPNSVESNWVIEEAEEANQQRKLIATRVESLEYRAIPLGFRGVHTDPVTSVEAILKALALRGVATASPPPKPLKPGKPAGAPGQELDEPNIADKIALEHWEYIKESRNPADFERFIGDFPASRLTPLAQMQLSRLATEAWQKLLSSEDIQGLQEFVRHFPSDARAADAKRRLEALLAQAEEAESWSRIKDTSDIDAYRQHISRFPGGANAMAARARLRLLEREHDAQEHWRAIAGATEPAPFEQFLATYPESSNAA
jgi:hypothetical protein